MAHGPAPSSEPVELENLPRAGEVIAGKYQIEKVIGAGGMGVVVIAKHLLLNQPVAVKFLHPQAAIRSDPVKRFLREARAAAALRSEHVARVLDVGELPSGDPFMVMEYLDGHPLSRVIRKRAPLPIEEAVDYILQACDAIGEAHKLNIVHRDLKPGNMFITTRPNGTALLKVLDFGISKTVGPDGGEFEQTLTATNMIMGSPQYASPEQLRSSKNVDTRTDIWALGVILYYMLAGRRPFDAETMSALIMAIGIGAPPPLTTLRPEVPLPLEDVVMRCLEKDREKRMPDVDTLTAALRPFAPLSAAATPPPAPGKAPMAMLSDIPSQPSMVLSHATTEPHAATLATRSAWTAPSPVRRRPPMLAIQVAAVAVAAIAGIAIYVRGRGGTPVDTLHVEAVSPATSASGKAPEPAPTPDVVFTDPIIDPNFAPAPDLTNTARQAPTAKPTATAATGPRDWAVANRAITLLDRSSSPVGRVPKGGRVKIMGERNGWAQVVYGTNEGMAMGWAPSAALTTAP